MQTWSIHRRRVSEECWSRLSAACRCWVTNTALCFVDWSGVVPWETTGTKTLLQVDKGKEVPSKPDFVLHVGEESPAWADVELLFEHTRSSKEVVTQKFSQWLRGARN